MSFLSSYKNLLKLIKYNLQILLDNKKIPSGSRRGKSWYGNLVRLVLHLVGRNRVGFNGVFAISQVGEPLFFPESNWMETPNDVQDVHHPPYPGSFRAGDQEANDVKIVPLEML